MYKLYLFDEYEEVTEEFIVHALRLLPENRRTRALRYRRTIDRWNCVITYLMLQYGLRKCFDITSFELAFGKYGKPYLPEYPDVHFNISHCDAGCAVAVADCPVGVDIQDIRPFSWNVAKRVCCAQEFAELERCVNRERLFAEIWAMKESYGKMTGEGIYELERIDTTQRDMLTYSRTVENADKIVALSGSTVAEMGTPEELKKNGVFARMVKLQTESQN